MLHFIRFTLLVIADFPVLSKAISRTASMPPLCTTGNETRIGDSLKIVNTPKTSPCYFLAANTTADRNSNASMNEVITSGWPCRWEMD
jgi:hypothetical protein